MFEYRCFPPDDRQTGGSDTPRVVERAAPYPAVVQTVQTRDALPVPLGLVPLGDADRVLLTPAHTLRLRNQLTRALQLFGWHGEPMDALLNAAEAIAGAALSHGVGGELQLRATADGDRVQVWVRDPGVVDELTPAFRDALASCDQAFLLTDEQGTTWVVEQQGDSRAR